MAVNIVTFCTCRGMEFVLCFDRGVVMGEWFLAPIHGRVTSYRTLMDFPNKRQAAANTPRLDTRITPKYAVEVVEVGTWPDRYPGMLNLVQRTLVAEAHGFRLRSTLLCTTLETPGFHPLRYRVKEVQVSMAAPEGLLYFLFPPQCHQLPDLIIFP